VNITCFIAPSSPHLLIDEDQGLQLEMSEEYLDIEQKGNYVSILDDVVFALRPEQSSFARLS
jgi:hypothetical protein